MKREGYRGHDLQTLELVSLNHRVILDELVTAHSLVVKRAIVLFGVAVHRAVQTLTPTGETEQPDVLAANFAAILFLFLLRTGLWWLCVFTSSHNWWCCLDWGHLIDNHGT